MGWQNAVLYHDKIRYVRDEEQKEKIRDSAIQSILLKARETIGSVSRPYYWQDKPWQGQGELNVEASLEEDVLLHSLLVEEKKEKRAEVIVCLDTSLSMTGEKFALLGVSVGVLALQLRDISIINFNSTARLVKSLRENKTPEHILRRFLDSPVKGLTNMESALQLAIKEHGKGKLNRRAVILISDGRHTAGASPEYLLPQLPKLHLLQVGRPWSQGRFFKRMSRLGGGKFIAISRFEQLPKALYTLVREILR